MLLLAIYKVVHGRKQEINTGTSPIATSRIINGTVDKKANQEPGDLG
jgi:hypothetical protein